MFLKKKIVKIPLLSGARFADISGNMFQRFLFIPIFSLILLGLSLWSHHVRSSVRMDAAEIQKSEFSEDARRRTELVEFLERIVLYEHYYHTAYGHYSHLMSQIGINIPSALSEHYEIRIVEANTDKLLISAFSTGMNHYKDIISVDHNYQIHSNFNLPPPRAAYLKANAYRFLKSMKAKPSIQNFSENAIFKGYFKYSEKSNSNGERIFIVEGKKPPVEGIYLELSENSLDADLNSELALEVESFDAEVNTAILLNKLNPLTNKGELPVIEINHEVQEAQKAKDKKVLNRKITSIYPRKPLEIEAILPNEGPKEASDRRDK